MRRISKRLWYAMGGLQNPKLHRHQLRQGVWRYYSEQ